MGRSQPQPADAGRRLDAPPISGSNSSDGRRAIRDGSRRARPDGPPVRDGKSVQRRSPVSLEMPWCRSSPWRKALRAQWACPRPTVHATPTFDSRPARSSRTSATRAWSRGVTGADHRALRDRGRCVADLAWRAPARGTAGGATARLSHPPLRHGRAFDRGRAAARLVPSARRDAPSVTMPAPTISPAGKTR